MPGQLGPLRDLGPCEVWFGTKDAETKVAETFGDVIFTFTTEAGDIKEDSQGVTIVDNVIIGVGECSVKAPFTRMGIAVLGDIIPGVDFESGASGEDDFLFGFPNVGRSAVVNGQSLILKPIVDGAVSTNSQEWLYLPLAFPAIAELEITYNMDGQRVYTVTFVGYGKTGTVDGTTREIMWHIGDDDVVTWA